MRDAEALIAAVKATPEDDAPRLVYADWLDDQQHHEQAQFIRVQVELARLWPKGKSLAEVTSPHFSLTEKTGPLLRE